MSHVENINATNVGPLSAFGENLSSEITPTMQIDALEGIRASRHETFVGASGTTTISSSPAGREFHCQSETTIGGYGLIRSKSVLRYRPGQGGRLRFTARFGTPVALSAQRAGGINVGTELSFGYNALDFGLLHRTGGRLEIQTLTISTPAGGAETLTLTLNGTGYTIALTSGTAAHNAFEIVEDNSFSATHSAYQNGSTVVFVSKAVGDETGAFTFSSTGAAVGSFAETSAGQAVTDSFITQANWNVNTLTDADRDGFVLDPSKGNVFEIQFQYLGYGMITYRVEDPATGRFIDVHRIKYAGANTYPSLETPIFKVGWFAASLGTTTNTEIFGASACGIVDGPIVPLKNPIAHANTKSSVTTTLTNIVSFRVRKVFDGFVNVAEVFPKIASIAVDGTKPAVAEIHINATLGGEPNWTYHDETEELMEFDTAATTVTGGQEIGVFALAKDGSNELDLGSLNTKLSPGDIITLAVKSTSGTTDTTAALVWSED